MDAHDKLVLLSEAGQYDLACACGVKDKATHRHRDATGSAWLYPITLPAGGKSIIMKTLLSSACVNDCKYCPLRAGSDSFQRCTLGADDMARLFLDYNRKHNLIGLFLSSGVIRDPDHTMARLNGVALVLRRKYNYRGFIHLKIIPGASEAAIEEAVQLASAVSVNIETPTSAHFKRLGTSKNWTRDLLRPMHLVRNAILNSGRSHVSQTTQFLVGPGRETDRDILVRSGEFYRNLRLQRIYFSAYQDAAGDPSLNTIPFERQDDSPEAQQAAQQSAKDRLTREHRLYQSDFLMRKYRFAPDDIPVDENGNLSIMTDPKKVWADRHPEAFPVSLAKADRWQLLRVPGMGPITVDRIINSRRNTVITSLDSLPMKPKRLALAKQYLVL